MKTSMRTILLTLSIAFLTASSAFALPKIIILGAEQSAWIQDIQSKLQATGQFSEVDYQVIPNGPSGVMPTLAQLQGYAAVMVFSDYGVESGLGSILASYVNGGGGVVLCMFSLGGDLIDASFDNSTYNVITPGSYTAGTTETLGTVAVPSSPIMNGVTSLNGGSESFHTTSTALNGNGQVIAYWNDGNICVASRTNAGTGGNVRRVDINMFPVSTAEYAGGWVPTTSGATLMANAMTWVAGGGAPVSALNITTSPLSNPRVVNYGIVPGGGSETYCVTANSIGPGTLHIQGVSITGSSSFTLVPGYDPVGDSILSGNSAQYCIQFSPTSSGAQTATFTLQTDGIDSGTQTVTLNGTGQIPTVSYSSNTMFQGVTTELTDTSSVQYLYVNSTGIGALTVKSVSLIGLDGGNAYFITHVPSGPIASGGVDSIGVRFDPDIEGLPDAHLVIQTNAGNIPIDTVTMDGVGILPHLTLVSPLPNVISNINHSMVITFDSVKLGTDSILTVLLTNPGSDTLAIEKNYFSSSDPDFTLTPLTGTDTLIPPGGVQTIYVNFDPVQQGYRTATLRIVTNIPHTLAQGLSSPARDTSEFNVQFIGTGVPSGKLLVTGPAQTDSALIGKSICQTDTLWNTGAASITVNSITISGTNGADFTVSGFTSGMVLGANSSATFQVCADPSQTGAETALLTASGTSSETPTKATLNLGVFGESVADTAIVAQPFAPESCGPDTMLVTVTNEGNVAETYQGSIPLNPNFTLLGSGTSPLTPAGGIDTFFVLFTPTSGTATGVLNFTTGGADISPITLSATGGTAVIAGSGTAPMTMVGSVDTFTATINNTGTCPWTPGVGQTTSDPAFAYLSGGTTPIPAGGSALNTFTYTPTEQGTDNATVGFPNQVGTSVPAANVTLTGTSSSANVAETSVSGGFSLQQNYPNPFSGTTNIEITLPVGCLVHLAIIDVEGQVVQTVLNQHYDAGSFEISLECHRAGKWNLLLPDDCGRRHAYAANGRHKIIIFD